MIWGIAKKLQKDANVRFLLAINPNISIGILKKLSLDKDTNVRLNVARNKQTPLNILEKLCNDPDSIVRSCAVENNKISVSTLIKLAKDKNSIVRYGVENNVNTPVDLVKKLAQDENVEVRYKASVNPNLPITIAIKTQIKLIDELRKSNTTLDCEIRQFLAANSNTPVIILEKLANDNYFGVRATVAENPNTPSYILKNLAATDEDINFCRTILKHPKCSLNIRRIIFDRFIQSRQPSLARLTVFLDNYADRKLLARNCYCKSWLERYAIAQNIQTPINTLKFLAKDANCVVRATAKANLTKSNICNNI